MTQQYFRAVANVYSVAGESEVFICKTQISVDWMKVRDTVLAKSKNEVQLKAADIRSMLRDLIDARNVDGIEIRLESLQDVKFYPYGEHVTKQLIKDQLKNLSVDSDEEADAEPADEEEAA